LSILFALCALLFALCSLPFASRAASIGVTSLSPWERAGVRVRSIAGERKEKEFSSLLALSPHPDPLPEGEGNNGDLTLSPRERAGVRVRSISLSWLSDHAWMTPPAHANSTDLRPLLSDLWSSTILASRNARTLSPPVPLSGGGSITAFNTALTEN